MYVKSYFLKGLIVLISIKGESALLTCLTIISFFKLIQGKNFIDNIPRRPDNRDFHMVTTGSGVKKRFIPSRS